MLKKILTIAAALVFFTQSASAAVFQVDTAHSQVQFTVDHLMISKVNGVFGDYQGTIIVDLQSKSIESVKATIQVASIDTRQQKRDAHLRSADFFDVEHYPEMNFVSKRIEGSGDNITVHGDLTIKGVTKEISLEGSFRGVAADPWGSVRAGFSASTVIDRRDFGLTWNKMLETGGLVVGNEVKISLEIEAIQDK